MSELEVKGITKRIRGQVVINDVSFRVEEGELFVLLGPSGSGKSTLLRLLCGLDVPERGQIFLNGVDITHHPPHQRNVAAIFQDYGLIPHMNVYDNIAYGLKVRGLSRSEIEKRINIVLQLLDMKKWAKNSLETLSGGEQQRVAIARALVKDAELFLFDEPISHLDPHLRHRARQEIGMVHRIKQKACIYITHDQNEAFAMANRIAVIGHGQIQQIGTAEDLLMRPSNLFIAQFIGHPPINIIEGFIHHVDTHYHLHMEGMCCILPQRWNKVLSLLGKRSKIIVGIRPNMIIPEWDFAHLGNIPHMVVRTKINHVDPMITTSIIHMNIHNGPEICAEFSDNPNFPIIKGQTFSIAMNINQLYLFNPHNGFLLNVIPSG